MFAGRVMSATPEGEVSVVAEFDDRTSGLGFLPDANGTPVAVLMDGRRLMRLERDQSRIHSDLSAEPARFINDMVMDAQGRAYLDFVAEVRRDNPERSRDCIMLVHTDGSYRVAATGDLYSPNGMALSGDRSTLIVAEGPKHRLTAFSVSSDGLLVNRRLFAETGEDRPDGICLDSEGCVWFGSPPTSRFVRIREGGEVAGAVPAPGRWAVACVLGGKDRQTLFMGSAQVPEILHAGKAYKLPLDEVIQALGQSHGYIETVEVEVPGAGTP